MIEHRLGAVHGFAALLQGQQLGIGERVDRQPVHLRGQLFDLGQGSQHRLTIGDSWGTHDSNI